MNKNINMLLNAIRDNQALIYFKLGKEPDEIKVNFDTLSNIETTKEYYIENILNGKYTTNIFGMRIFIDDKLKDNNFELTFTDINLIL